jgi:hypothetical protein
MQSMARRRNAVRLGIPALIVAVLTFIALWRVGIPTEPSSGASGGERRGAPAADPITTIGDIIGVNASGRRATLESVEILQVASPRTFWIGPPEGQTVFAVLDPDVRRHPDVRMTPGARVSVTGLVRPSPAPEQAMRQWQLDEATARVDQARGTYLHVTEIRPSL